MPQLATSHPDHQSRSERLCRWVKVVHLAASGWCVASAAAKCEIRCQMQCQQTVGQESLGRLACEALVLVLVDRKMESLQARHCQ